MAPPKNDANFPVISMEFFKLYKWLKSSPYYTDNAETACIKISNVDFLILSRIEHGARQIGQFLSSEPYWRQGQYSLFLNFVLNSDLSKLPTGKGLIASADFRHSNIRFGFDIPIGYYSELISFLTPIEVHKNIDLVAELDYRGDLIEHILPAVESNKTTTIMPSG